MDTIYVKQASITSYLPGHILAGIEIMAVIYRLREALGCMVPQQKLWDCGKPFALRDC